MKLSVLKKSVLQTAAHLVVAFGVSYFLTGNWMIALAITAVEPTLNTAFYLLDRWFASWGKDLHLL